MSSKAADKTRPGDAPQVDLDKLEQLGRSVMASMQALRELFTARATALEQCRDALEE
jgi:hypothetical protein